MAKKSVSELFEEILPTATEEQQAAALKTVVNTLSMESTMDDPIEQMFQSEYNRLIAQGELSITDDRQFNAFSMWCAEKGNPVYLASTKKLRELELLEEAHDAYEYVVKLVNNPFTPEIKTRIDNIRKGYQRRHPKEKNFSPKVEDQIDLATILLKAYHTTDSKEASMAFNREWQLYKNQPKEDQWSIYITRDYGSNDEMDYVMCHSVSEFADALAFAEQAWTNEKYLIVEILRKPFGEANNKIEGSFEIDPRTLQHLV